MLICNHVACGEVISRAHVVHAKRPLHDRQGPHASGLQATGTASQGIHAIVLWFDTEFSPRFCKEESVVLTTSPHGPQTHWYQTVLQLRHPVAAQRSAHSAGVQQSSRAVMQGRISCARGSEHRCLDISLECVGVDGKGQTTGEFQTQLYSISMS